MLKDFKKYSPYLIVTPYIYIFASLNQYIVKMIHLRIKEVASSKGMMLKDVCEKAGYKSLPSFYRQINNPDKVNMRTLIRIADVLDCEVADFFHEEREPGFTMKCPHCGKEIKVSIK